MAISIIVFCGTGKRTYRGSRTTGNVRLATREASGQASTARTTHTSRTTGLSVVQDLAGHVAGNSRRSKTVHALRLTTADVAAVSR
jgi:hypothetical protein